MAEVSDALKEHDPVMLSSIFCSKLVDRIDSAQEFSPARDASSTSTGHAMILSGMSTKLKASDGLWFQVRNSWGERWAKMGKAFIDVKHCLLKFASFWWSKISN
jgi:aminopeptidase C